MRFHNLGATIFVPDGRPPEDALRRVTHLGIGAHPDDLEIMAFHGIVQHRLDARNWFGGIVVCDGGPLRKTRRREQQKAARLGNYAAVAMLDYPSAAAKRRINTGIAADLASLLALMRPEFVYTHNPADKHPTHVAVCRHVLAALRSLPKSRRPKKVYGCEVWRGLDWLPETDKVRLDCRGEPAFARKLVRIFASQTGGKRYVEATLGRRRANATFDDPRNPDRSSAVTYAIDLTPFVRSGQSDLSVLIRPILDRFTRGVLRNLA